MALRTRFWMGVGTPEPVPDEAGVALMQHAHTEFRYGQGDRKAVAVLGDVQRRKETRQRGGAVSLVTGTASW